MTYENGMVTGRMPLDDLRLVRIDVTGCGYEIVVAGFA